MTDGSQEQHGGPEATTGETIPSEPSEPSALGAEPAPEGEGQSTDALARVRREAAQRRIQLREVEQERDRLREEVATFQRNAVEALAASGLEDGSDLWRDGVELGELLADDGTVDADLVVEAVERVVEAHPGWAKGRRAHDPDFGAGAGRGQAANGPLSFGQALKAQIGQPPR